MGVLDQLKQEAQAIEAAKTRAVTSRADALAASREQLGPCIRTAYKYFIELKKHLLATDRHIEASYDIRDAGHIDGLIQSQYGVATENPEQIDKFSFRCVCAKSGVLQVNQGDPASVSAYRDYLRSNGLQAKIRDSTRSKGGALFMVQPAVPVAVEFSADYERGKVGLRLRNLTTIGVVRHRLETALVDEKFLDEIAKAVLRQANRFDVITGNSISDADKLSLRKKVQEEHRQKALAEETERREAELESTIGRRFGRTFFGRG